MNWITTVVMAILISTSAQAQATSNQLPPSKQASPSQQATKPNQYGQTLSFDSKVLNESRELQVYLPESYQKNTGQRYPVMYILDGQSYFLHGVTFQKTLGFVQKSPDFIVVGLNTDFRKRRHLFDYQTPKFIEFLKKDLLPFVDKNYRTNDERILFGWEMAGGMATEIMADTNLFDAYLVASPTHISDERIAKLKPKLATTNNNGPYLYIAQSGDESVADDLDEVLLPMVSKNANFKYEALIGEDHHTTAYRTITNGLRKHFSDYQPVIFWSIKEYQDFGGMEKLKSHYKARGIRYGISQQIHDRTQFSMLMRSIREDNYLMFDSFLTEFTAFVDEMAFEWWGEEWALFYLKHKKFIKAEKVLIKSLVQYPESALLHGAMGDVLSGAGHKSQAGMAYKSAIKFANANKDPAAKDYQAKLDAL